MNAYIDLQLYCSKFNINWPLTIEEQKSLGQYLVNEVCNTYDVIDVIWVPPVVPVSNIDTSKEWLRLSYWRAGARGYIIPENWSNY